jgi:predicted DNA-binding transcriptional regulator AlpA
MVQQIQFIQTTPQDLQQQIAEGVKSQLQEFLNHYKPKQPNEYVTRKQVAEMFDVDLSTIHNWCKSGKLKPLGIGGRVFFLRSDIEQSLQPLTL